MEAWGSLACRHWWWWWWAHHSVPGYGDGADHSVRGGCGAHRNADHSFCFHFKIWGLWLFKMEILISVKHRKWEIWVLLISWKLYMCTYVHSQPIVHCTLLVCLFLDPKPRHRYHRQICRTVAKQLTSWRVMTATIFYDQWQDSLENPLNSEIWN